MNQQVTHPKETTASGNKSQSASVKKETSLQKTADTITLPASKATFEAAAKAEGMKKIELEIAVAAGLLRLISPEPEPSARSFEDLLRIVEELKNPAKSHDLDLFE